MGRRQPRFKVATCTGYAITAAAGRGGGGHALGLSAHVLDRWRCHRVVRTYRSEDVNMRYPKQRGHGRARALALAEMDRLNRQQRRVDGRE